MVILFNKAKYFFLSTPLYIFVLWALFTIVLVRTAWLGDDPFITLRTVDNFINGYGLTWNVIERVQSYTHPLWMLVLSGVYFFTREGYYTTLGVSIIISVATFILITRMFEKHTVVSLTLICTLILSNAFIDYSTSGLENPLSHLLFAVFIYLLIKSQENLSNKTIFLLSLLAGLASLNRMDTILLYVPALIWILYKKFSLITIQKLVLGFLPFFAWEIFSLIYYGFPFPNTAYSKLGNDLPRMDLLEMGYLYFLNSLDWDPITLTIIAIAIIWGMTHGFAIQKVIAFSLGLYLLYLLWIGGDFMSGRFFSVVLLGAVALLLWMIQESINLENLNISLPLLVVFLAMLPIKSSLATNNNPTLFVNGIANERNYYSHGTGLINDQKDTLAPDFSWVKIGLKLKEMRKDIEVLDIAGMIPYHAGPEVYFIDPIGLTDPLLSRLPPRADMKHRVGHYERSLPDGYHESVLGENKIKHPSLAAYYDKLVLVTRGPIWSWERFVAIFELNTGKYDYLLEQYAKDEVYK